MINASKDPMRRDLPAQVIGRHFGEEYRTATDIRFLLMQTILKVEKMSKQQEEIFGKSRGCSRPVSGQSRRIFSARKEVSTPVEILSLLDTTPSPSRATSARGQRKHRIGYAARVEVDTLVD
jgi:hypothetical protein